MKETTIDLIRTVLHSAMKLSLLSLGTASCESAARLQPRQQWKYSK